MTMNRIPYTRENSLNFPFTNPRDHWKYVFDKYDTNKDGHISVCELDELIKSRDYELDIPEHVVKRIHIIADINNDGQLDFNEFVGMIQDPALRPLFGSLVNRYINMIVVPIKSIQYHNELEYEDQFKCCPPPVGMIMISLIEIILYLADITQGSTAFEIGPVGDALIYDPKRRNQLWRYFTYILVHIGVLHLIVNLCVQLLLGVPLEMVHKWWRVLLIYFAGVAAGSLATSIVDPTVKLAGASGGVYALVTAHISTIILNWKEMEYGVVQLLILLIMTGSDLGSTVYNRHVLKRDDQIGYVAHIAGAVAGLLVGINILRNIHVTKTEKLIWWVSIVTYGILMTVAIIWNGIHCL